MDFNCPQRSGGIGGKIRISGSGPKNDHPALFEMTDGAAADEGFSNLLHFDGGLQTRCDSLFFQSGLQGHAIDHGGEHPHVITLGTLHPA